MPQSKVPTTNAEFDSLLPGQPLSRRHFVAGALGAGFALAVQPVMAQSVIQTSAEGLLAGEVAIPVADGQLAAYRAAPQGQRKLPIILVVSEIFGVHEYIRDVCRRLAKLGYLAIAPQLFARQGDPSAYSSIPELMAAITSKTPDAQVLADLDACLAWAEAQGVDSTRLGVTGFCWGGRITWLYAAHQPRVKAGVAWYGRLIGPANAVTPRHPVDLAGQLHAPVLGLYGEVDPGIPLETVEQMRRQLAAGNAAAQASLIEVYPQAPHAFHADYRPSYRRDAAEDGWRRLQAWFRQQGVV